MPVNALLIRALLNFHLYYDDNFKIECPTGSGRLMNLFEVAKEIADRLTRIFSAMPRDAGPYTAARKRSRRMRTGATISYSLSTSMATTGRVSVRAPNRMDRIGSEADSALWIARWGEAARGWQEWGVCS